MVSVFVICYLFIYFYNIFIEFSDFMSKFLVFRVFNQNWVILVKNYDIFRNIFTWELYFTKLIY